MDPALISFGLSILGLTLLVFSLGAISGWVWAVKSLVPRPPLWLTAVLGAGGLSFIGAQLVSGDWLGAAGTTVLYTLLVGGNLRIGPFRPKSGSSQTT